MWHAYPVTRISSWIFILLLEVAGPSGRSSLGAGATLSTLFFTGGIIFSIVSAILPGGWPKPL